MQKIEDSLQGEVLFLPIAYQDPQTVKVFLGKVQKRLGIKVFSVTSDTLLSKLFPHRTLPHYVWIDKGGKIRAITGLEDITVSNIQSILGNKAFTLTLKKDSIIAYDKKKPLFFNGNGGNGSSLIYHSLFSEYVEGLPPGLTVYNKAHGGKIVERNVPILWLLNLAYGKGKQNFPIKNQIILDVEDSSRFLTDATGSEYEKWAEKNAYCYELIVPEHLYDKRYKIMQEDMTRLLPEINVSIENRKALCWVLTCVGNINNLVTKGGKAEVSFTPLSCHIRNKPLSLLFKELKVIYLQNASLPIVDGTNFKGNINLDFRANMSNIDSINAALEKYHLRFIKEYRMIPFLVIKDSSTYSGKRNG
jgi:hypothetical protein